MADSESRTTSGEYLRRPVPGPNGIGSLIDCGGQRTHPTRVRESPDVQGPCGRMVHLNLKVVAARYAMAGEKVVARPAL